MHGYNFENVFFKEVMYRKSTNAIIHVPNKQKEGHVKPDGATAHGLCLARPSTTICVSGVGGGKTLVALNIAARTAEGLGDWKHIYLLSPNVEAAAAGEYALLDVTCLHEFPPLNYFDDKPGASLFICDDWDLKSLSSKGAPDSQKMRADRLMGNLSTHHPGSLNVIVCTQSWTMVPPNLRRLATVFCLWPNRIARDGIGHIARGVMIEKRMLEYIFDQCGDDPHSFVLIENDPVPGRSRVRLNGVTPIADIL